MDITLRSLWCTLFYFLQPIPVPLGKNGLKGEQWSLVLNNMHLIGSPVDLHSVERDLATWFRQFPPLKRVLIVPPDITRSHSLAGTVLTVLRKLLPHSEMDVLPALGTHTPMTEQERRALFGDAYEGLRFIEHDWRHGVREMGEIPSHVLEEVSGGRVNYSIKVGINEHLFDPEYDLILSVGQVVPHEVVGMANYTKNIVVGCGGKDMIDKSHFLGAVCGMESIMGRSETPVRQVFDYAEEHFLKDLPIIYLLTVTQTYGEHTDLMGFFAGRGRELFQKAAARSQEVNITLLPKAIQKAVVYLDEQEFKTTWLGNKAIYRTRMAMATNGELVILAPGVRRFGEDPQIDELIRKFGYSGTTRILELTKNHPELANNLSAAAHLIHGSAEGRFTITYAVRHLRRDEVETVGYEYLAYDEALETYPLDRFVAGWNTLSEKKFIISAIQTRIVGHKE